jgi:hypothetical protein
MNRGTNKNLQFLFIESNLIILKSLIKKNIQLCIGLGLKSDVSFSLLILSDIVGSVNLNTI